MWWPPFSSSSGGGPDPDTGARHPKVCFCRYTIDTSQVLELAPPHRNQELYSPGSRLWRVTMKPAHLVVDCAPARALSLHAFSTSYTPIVSPQPPLGDGRPPKPSPLCCPSFVSTVLGAKPPLRCLTQNSTTRNRGCCLPAVVSVHNVNCGGGVACVGSIARGMTAEAAAEAVLASRPTNPLRGYVEFMKNLRFLGRNGIPDWA